MIKLFKKKEDRKERVREPEAPATLNESLGDVTVICQDQEELKDSLKFLLFDEDYYLKKNPDVADADIDGYEHYANYGWKEGRNPSPNFDTKKYLKEHPDIAAENVCPVEHFINFGYKERRKIFPVDKIKNDSVDLEGSEYEVKYQEDLGIAMGARSPHYSPLMEGDVVYNKDNDPSIIAFYLPQFHPFKENDKWWGKGFTEWTNVSKAQKQFVGHYQPRLPGELGFYDLRLPQVMARQIELAKKHGITGFCFHYYWFDSHRLMEQPLEAFLYNKSNEFDFPFCICWANENWTRRWDGSEHDVLIAQNHSEEDNKKVFYDILRYMRDSRYIKVDGKPKIIIYRPDIIDNVKSMVDQWRTLAVQEGFPGLHLVCTNAFGFNEPESLGFDALVEFPPHGLNIPDINSELAFYNKNHQGVVYSYQDVIDFSLNRLGSINEGVKKAYYPTLMTGWDNEARKPGRGHTFHGANPLLFQRWLSETFAWSNGNHEVNNKFIYVNAWNEWAEGTYLEPDRNFGYGYLSAVARVRFDQVKRSSEVSAFVSNYNANYTRKSEVVLYAHIFYHGLIDEIASYLSQVKYNLSADVFISVPQDWDSSSIEYLTDKIKIDRLFIFNNKGRDILPFIKVLKVIEEEGYIYSCKVHGKKSSHISAGDKWRQELLGSLLSIDSAKYLLNILKDSPSSGFSVPKGVVKSFDKNNLKDNRVWVEKMKNYYGLEIFNNERFLSGSMFWFKIAALKGLSDISEDMFEPELGAIDGTLAHALERLIPALGRKNGYTIYECDQITCFDPYS